MLPDDQAVHETSDQQWLRNLVRLPIDDTDQRSKSTLALIQALLNLQLAEPQRAGPVLTLPVGL